MYIIGYPLLALVEIINGLLFMYTIIIIGSVIVSWLKPDPYHPAVRILTRLTEPLYMRIRRYMPRAGYIDLAPLAALLAIMFVQKGILPILARVAANLIGA